MSEEKTPYLTGNLPASRPMRGVTGGDVERAADGLLRQGERPTVEKVRKALGTGSPNTINPLLDAWWKKIGSRLDAGPAALHRLPESVAHVAEALWIQALEEGRRRAQLETKVKSTTIDQQQASLEVRSHVLTLREGELDDRLKERERTVSELRLQLRELTMQLRKEQVSRESLERRVESLRAVGATPRRPAAPKRIGAAKWRPTKKTPRPTKLAKKSPKKRVTKSSRARARKRR